ncbi:binding--dependent transport system inner membrane component domain protein [Bacillus pseudomycoides]|nr:binding--dependent transport system inner membrane component domain protein [Bacillus pseudomycoides]
MKINKSRSYIRNVFLDRDHRSLNKLQDKKKIPNKISGFYAKGYKYSIIVPSAKCNWFFNFLSDSICNGNDLFVNGRHY